MSNDTYCTVRLHYTPLPVRTKVGNDTQNTHTHTHTLRNDSGRKLMMQGQSVCLSHTSKVRCSLENRLRWTEALSCGLHCVCVCVCVCMRKCVFVDRGRVPNIHLTGSICQIRYHAVLNVCVLNVQNEYEHLVRTHVQYTKCKFPLKKSMKMY